MKTRAVVYTLDAQHDLIDLYDWIATRAEPSVAIGYVERLQAFCERLSHGSERGHRRDDLRPGLRVLGFERRVTIAFAVMEHEVVILRLFYAGRNIDAAFREAES